MIKVIALASLFLLRKNKTIELFSSVQRYIEPPKLHPFLLILRSRQRRSKWLLWAYECPELSLSYTVSTTTSKYCIVISLRPT